MKKLLFIIGVALCASLYASKSNEDVKSVDVTIAATTDTVATDTPSSRAMSFIVTEAFSLIIGWFLLQK